MTIGFSHCCDLLMWQEMFKGFEKEAELVFFILLFCSLLSFYPQGWCVLLLGDEHGFGNLSAVELFIKKRPTFNVSTWIFFYFLSSNKVNHALVLIGSHL